MADTTTKQRHFIIAGAGLGGALLANFLGRAGHRVDVYEKRPDPRSGKVDAGRSINLAISVRGLHAVEQAGLLDKVLAQAVPMRGRMMHDAAGNRTYQPYGKDDSQAINSVARGGLNLILIEGAARYPNVKFHFEHRCTDVDLDRAEVEVVDEQAGKSFKAAGDAVLGSDGAFSAIRARMQKLDRFDYSQSYLTHGYKELTIPARPGGGFAMEKNALHIWPRRSFMMIALPNADGSYTVTLFWPFKGYASFERLTTPDDVLGFFRHEFGDAVPLMPDLARDYFENPTSSLVTVRCGPWNYRDKVALLGDAAHAVVPFYGQGMNCAFEDAVEFDRCLAEYPNDLARAFERYHERRKENADALADLALHNFVEMRDRVASPVFLAKKKFETWLYRKIPDYFIPLYDMISFTRIPYAEARARGRFQDRVLYGGGGFVLLLLVWAIFGH